MADSIPLDLRIISRYDDVWSQKLILKCQSDYVTEV